MKLFVAVVILVVVTFTASAQEAEQKRNALYGEVACATMYHGFDVGGDFFSDPVCKTWVNYDRQVKKRVTLSFGTWMQKAANAPRPNDAEEVDVSFSVSYAAGEQTAITGSAANYTVHGLNIQKFAFAVVRDLKIGKHPVTVSNETALFTTTRRAVLKGGVVNRTELSSGVSLTKRTTLSGSAALAVDNGPFGLGGPALVGFASGRLEQQLTKNFSVFGQVRYSAPLAGTTSRERIVSGEVGMAFRFDF